MFLCHFTCSFKVAGSEQQFLGQVALQVRIKPDSYDVIPQTVGLREKLDPHFPNDELEWATNWRGVIIIVGILIRVEKA